MGSGNNRIADLHRRSRQQVVQRLIAPGRRHDDEREQAEYRLDDEAYDSFQKADVAAMAIIDHAQIDKIVPEGAAGERDQNWFIQQPWRL